MSSLFFRVNGLTPMARIEAKSNNRNCAKLRYSLFIVMVKCLLSGRESINSILKHLKASLEDNIPYEMQTKPSAIPVEEIIRFVNVS